MKILQLPDILANKIAAGEVVERPASVVKELAENSIDAGSTWIKVEITEAGLQTIKITDNGDGMSKEDCERAILRHATSKIKFETDLFRIQTLGFRGEALASIAAVSKLEIKTSIGGEAGTYLSIEGGKVIDQSRSDARKGTEIIVKDLFFNTPARLKYMKTIHTELGHITDLLNRLALANPSIRFEVSHNGRSLFATTGTGDLQEVIAQVYGMNIARKMIPVEHETLDFKIKGYISKPELTRATRAYISTIINGRYIRNIGLANAITRGYHTLLPIHRLPIVILSIEMDPVLVDVNVHPTKLEVRFSKEKELFHAIEQMIRNKLRSISLIPEIEPTKTNEKQSTQTNIQFEHATDSRMDIPKQYGEVINEVNPSNIPLFSDFKVNKVEQEMTQLDEQSAQLKPTDHGDSQIPALYPIGQLQGTYIMAQNDQGLYMVDQHAAQERIKYEEFKKKLSKPGNETQQLLLPVTFDFSKKEAIYIDQFKEELAEVGLYFEEFGHNTYAIRSYPTWFPKGFEEEIIRDMVDQIMEEQKISIKHIREEAAIMMACKGSIKANHYLTETDMFKLLEELRQTTDPFTCPHGRPIIIHFSTYELEKMFKRIM